MAHEKIIINVKAGNSNFMEIIQFISETQKGTFTQKAPVEINASFKRVMTPEAESVSNFEAETEQPLFGLST